MEKLYYAQFADYLETHPEKALEIEPDQWKTLRPDEWVFAIQDNPEIMLPYFKKYCGWEKLYGEDWAMLLFEHPEYSIELDNINAWDKLNDHDPAGYWDWSIVLMWQPQFFDKCVAVNGLDGISIYEWEKIFSLSPDLYLKVADRNILKSFDCYKWRDLFENLTYNNNADKVPFFENLAKEYTCGVAELLIRYPQRADEYKLINEFSGYEWSYVLSENDIFIDLCKKYKGWEKIAKNIDIVKWLNEYASEAVKNTLALYRKENNTKNKC